MEQEELKILEAFKERDAKAFEHIFELHRKALVYFAEKILGIREEAEDIAAETFMKLWARHTDFDSFPAIKSFLYVTVRNASLNFLRYSKKVSSSQKEYSYWADNKEEEILRIMYKAELLAELDREIELLPGKCQDVFRLSFYEGLGTTEIADKLGLTDQNVRNHKARALQLIRTAFLKRNLTVGILLYSMCHQHSFFVA